MASKNILKHDDYFELKIRAKFQKNVTPFVTEKESQRINGFMVLLTKGGGEEIFMDKNDHTFGLDGLVIFFLTHDSHDDQNSNVQNYFVTWRYFTQPIEVSREYLKIIFDKKNNFDYCDFQPGMRQMVDLKFIVDFELYNHLVFKYADLNNNETVCFEIKDIFKYLTKTKTFFFFQQVNGFKYTLSTEIHSIELNEKETRLDIEESLTVSHHLVEEIFDKLNTFTEIFADDKEGIASLLELQNKLIEKVAILEINAKDLNRGSTKFQDFMLENFNKHKIVTPRNYPRLMTIKRMIENLNDLQVKVFNKFVDIKNLVNSKDVFKKTFDNFNKMNDLLKQIVKEVSSKEFKAFYKKTKTLMSVIKKVNFDAFFKQVENTINYQNSSTKNIGYISLFIVIIILVCLLTFSGLILRIIKSDRKQSF